MQNMNKINNFLKEVDNSGEETKKRFQSVAQSIANAKNVESAKSAADDFFDEIIFLAKEKGYNITKEEFLEYFKEKSNELSDDALESASGGGFGWLNPLAWGSAIGSAAFSTGGKIIGTLGTVASIVVSPITNLFSSTETAKNSSGSKVSVSQIVENSDKGGNNKKIKGKTNKNKVRQSVNNNGKKDDDDKNTFSAEQIAEEDNYNGEIKDPRAIRKHTIGGRKEALNKEKLDEIINKRNSSGKSFQKNKDSDRYGSISSKDFNNGEEESGSSWYGRAARGTWSGIKGLGNTVISAPGKISETVKSLFQNRKQNVSMDEELEEKAFLLEGDESQEQQNQEEIRDLTKKIFKDSVHTDLDSDVKAFGKFSSDEGGADILKIETDVTGSIKFDDIKDILNPNQIRNIKSDKVAKIEMSVNGNGASQVKFGFKLYGSDSQPLHNGELYTTNLCEGTKALDICKFIDLTMLKNGNQKLVFSGGEYAIVTNAEYQNKLSDMQEEDEIKSSNAKKKKLSVTHGNSDYIFKNVLKEIAKDLKLDTSLNNEQLTQIANDKTISDSFRSLMSWGDIKDSDIAGYKDLENGIEQVLAKKFEKSENEYIKVFREKITSILKNLSEANQAMEAYINNALTHMSVKEIVRSILEEKLGKDKVSSENVNDCMQYIDVDSLKEKIDLNTIQKAGDWKKTVYEKLENAVKKEVEKYEKVLKHGKTLTYNLTENIEGKVSIDQTKENDNIIITVFESKGNENQALNHLAISYKKGGDKTWIVKNITPENSKIILDELTGKKALNHLAKYENLDKYIKGLPTYHSIDQDDIIDVNMNEEIKAENINKEAEKQTVKSGEKKDDGNDYESEGIENKKIKGKSDGKKKSVQKNIKKKDKKLIEKNIEEELKESGNELNEIESMKEEENDIDLYANESNENMSEKGIVVKEENTDNNEEEKKIKVNEESIKKAITDVLYDNSDDLSMKFFDGNRELYCEVVYDQGFLGNLQKNVTEEDVSAIKKKLENKGDNVTFEDLENAVIEYFDIENELKKAKEEYDKSNEDEDDEAEIIEQSGENGENMVKEVETGKDNIKEEELNKENKNEKGKENENQDKENENENECVKLIKELFNQGDHTDSKSEFHKYLHQGEGNGKLFDEVNVTEIINFENLKSIVDENSQKRLKKIQPGKVKEIHVKLVPGTYLTFDLKIEDEEDSTTIYTDYLNYKAESEKILNFVNNVILKNVKQKLEYNKEKGGFHTTTKEDNEKKEIEIIEEDKKSDSNENVSNKLKKEEDDKKDSEENKKNNEVDDNQNENTEKEEESKVENEEIIELSTKQREGIQEFLGNKNATVESINTVNLPKEFEGTTVNIIKTKEENKTLNHVVISPDNKKNELCVIKNITPEQLQAIYHDLMMEKAFNPATLKNYTKFVKLATDKFNIVPENIIRVAIDANSSSHAFKEKSNLLMLTNEEGQRQGIKTTVNDVSTKENDINRNDNNNNLNLVKNLNSGDINKNEEEKKVLNKNEKKGEIKLGLGKIKSIKNDENEKKRNAEDNKIVNNEVNLNDSDAGLLKDKNEIVNNNNTDNKNEKNIDLNSKKSTEKEANNENKIKGGNTKSSNEEKTSLKSEEQIFEIIANFYKENNKKILENTAVVKLGQNSSYQIPLDAFKNFVDKTIKGDSYNKRPDLTKLFNNQVLFDVVELYIANKVFLAERNNVAIGSLQHLHEKKELSEQKMKEFIWKYIEKNVDCGKYIDDTLKEITEETHTDEIAEKKNDVQENKEKEESNVHIIKKKKPSKKVFNDDENKKVGSIGKNQEKKAETDKSVVLDANKVKALINQAVVKSGQELSEDEKIKLTKSLQEQVTDEKVKELNNKLSKTAKEEDKIDLVKKEFNIDDSINSMKGKIKGGTSKAARGIAQFGQKLIRNKNEALGKKEKIKEREKAQQSGEMDDEILKEENLNTSEKSLELAEILNENKIENKVKNEEINASNEQEIKKEDENRKKYENNNKSIDETKIEEKKDDKKSDNNINEIIEEKEISSTKNEENVEDPEKNNEEKQNEKEIALNEMLKEDNDTKDKDEKMKSNNEEKENYDDNELARNNNIQKENIKVGDSKNVENLNELNDESLKNINNNAKIVNSQSSKNINNKDTEKSNEFKEKEDDNSIGGNYTIETNNNDDKVDVTQEKQPYVVFNAEDVKNKTGLHRVAFFATVRANSSKDYYNYIKDKDGKKTSKWVNKLVGEDSGKYNNLKIPEEVDIIVIQGDGTDYSDNAFGYYKEKLGLSGEWKNAETEGGTVLNYLKGSTVFVKPRKNEVQLTKNKVANDLVAKVGLPSENFEEHYDSKINDLNLDAITEKIQKNMEDKNTSTDEGGDKDNKYKIIEEINTGKEKKDDDDKESKENNNDSELNNQSQSDKRNGNKAEKNIDINNLDSGVGSNSINQAGTLFTLYRMDLGDDPRDEVQTLFQGNGVDQANTSINKNNEENFEKLEKLPTVAKYKDDYASKGKSRTIKGLNADNKSSVTNLGGVKDEDLVDISDNMEKMGFGKNLSNENNPEREKVDNVIDEQININVDKNNEDIVKNSENLKDADIKNRENGEQENENNNINNKDDVTQEGQPYVVFDAEDVKNGTSPHKVAFFATVKKGRSSDSYYNYIKDKNGNNTSKWVNKLVGEDSGKYANLKIPDEVDIIVIKGDGTDYSDNAFDYYRNKLQLGNEWQNAETERLTLGDYLKGSTVFVKQNTAAAGLTKNKVANNLKALIGVKKENDQILEQSGKLNNLNLDLLTEQISSQSNGPEAGAKGTATGGAEDVE